MKRFLLTALTALTFLCQPLFAQQPCAFDKVHKQLLTEDPEYARQVELNNQSIRSMIQSHPEWKTPTASRVEALYTIPVVVHVMHTGGAVGSTYNPTDAQIVGAINYLNQVYAGTYTGMTPAAPGGAAGDMQIQFALAQRTPTCGATNGIDRVDASALSGYIANGVNSNSSASDIALKDLARWNPAQYYNIWVVNKIDGNDGTSGQFIAGYALFAGGPTNRDGTVMLATQMVAGQKTLPHEVGHALNLYHPFEGSSDDTQCPSNLPSCTSAGDQCCDTDPIRLAYNVGTGLYSFNCRTGANPCGGTYSINTESNFMSYTNCYTLFTNDQKARVQAAMALPSRASLVDASNLALTPCGTVVNFHLVSASTTESTGGTLNVCRRYTDYTYKMAIGSAASATATATLSLSGTATQGLDYDITTNGDFNAPSNVVTFPSGSSAAQNFIVRVYDDGNVESSETVIVDFTLNNGGGNATKGTNAPTFTLTLGDNDVAPTGANSDSYQVGTPTVNNTSGPFNAAAASQRGQYLYRASELAAAGVPAGNLTELYLYVGNKVSTRPFQNFTIRMGTTSLTNLRTGGSFTAVTGLTQVFTTASYSTIAGWNQFIFQTPFVWDGVSNIVYEICFDNGTTDGTAGYDATYQYLDGSSSSDGNMFYQAGINCGGSYTTVTAPTSGRKPIIGVGFVSAGTAVETASGSTSAQHIAVGSNDYFYSNNNKLVARLSSISAPLGCVSANVTNAGTTWTGFSGGQRSAKVLQVTPTTNGSTASYTIALYFDNSELGGKTASTLKIAKSTAASIAGANSSNTILVTPTVSTLGTNTTVFTGSFTGFSLFFLVDGAVTLPINLVDFTGRVNNDQNTVLEWKTASEQNNREFEIEVSRDGSNFALLGTVASKGNSATLQSYDYLHIKPQAGISWYRLKQKDWDGRYTYSKVINLDVHRSMLKTFVYPIPARDLLTVNFGEPVTTATIEIFSSDMKVVKKDFISSLTIRRDVSVSGLTPGVYFARITTGDKKETVKFIKE